MSTRAEQKRRFVAIITAAVVIAMTILFSGDMWQAQTAEHTFISTSPGEASKLLATIPIKGRAPKTYYERTQFGNGWATRDGCDTRNAILYRDLKHASVGEDCKIQSGTLDDPYTGKVIEFRRGASSSSDVQIDHVVALSDAWQKGAQQLTRERRIELANDPLELLAVDGPANQEKSGSDAASWLPSNKSFRCQYVARQLFVKAKYRLWISQAEHDTIAKVLSSCPGQALPAA